MSYGPPITQVQVTGSSPDRNRCLRKVMLTFMLMDTRARRTGMRAFARAVRPRSSTWTALGYMHAISSTRGHLDLRPLDWGHKQMKGACQHGSLVPIVPAIW